jgi:hypothetical protein
MYVYCKYYRKFPHLSYKLGLDKSLTGLGLNKFKKPWAWACPKKISTPGISCG